MIGSDHKTNTFAIRMIISRLKVFFTAPIFSDIRFWIALYFMARLFHITQPPLEIAHNWRQCTGLMVSRNFYEINANIFYPRVDMAGDKTGITGTEFPLFNYLIYLVAKIFGWTDWYGRLINLIVSSFGIYWFYRLVKKYFNPRMAFYASFVLLNSLWFAYSRKTMPDTFSLSLATGALLFALNYLADGRRWQLLLFAVFGFCGIMSKIPAGYLFVLFILPFLNKEIHFVRKFFLTVVFAIIMVPVVWWYFIWVPYLVKEFGFWHYYMGTSMENGAHEIATHLSQAAEKFYFAALNFIGFTLCIGGLVLGIINKQKRLLWVISLCSLAFFLFILKAGFAFYHHNYYIMPFVPVMALLAGYLLSEIKKPGIRNILALAIACEVILNALPEFRINRDQQYKLRLESIVSEYSDKNDLIAINCGPNPQQIYLAHRKGWNLEDSSQLTVSYMDQIKNKGCKLLIINIHESFAPSFSYRVVFKNEDFILYKL